MQNSYDWMTLLAASLCAACLMGCAAVRNDVAAGHISKKPFGKTADGTPVDLYTLRNVNGVEATICNYGGIVTSLKVPDSKGRMTSISNLTLQQLQEAQPAIVTGVGDQSSSLLELLRQKNIGIGTKLEIKQRHAFDGSVEIKLRNQPLINLSEQLAKNILVKTV